ncbi:hypothetical protein V22_22960 [Calycomorphotria hydatis]|uniref:Uncharacterized protein n=1 Tax=Calycomorphotria hydatis TaxID=2528027 RepID=A0A517T9J1_9PLAN|nr:hypothetical protein V22_22960 [Calycomorphotria hydatis]
MTFLLSLALILIVLSRLHAELAQASVEWRADFNDGDTDRLGIFPAFYLTNLLRTVRGNVVSIWKNRTLSELSLSSLPIRTDVLSDVPIAVRRF